MIRAFLHLVITFAQMLFLKFHKVLAFFLTGFYFLSVMKPIFPVLDYTLHYGAYANVLCENKDKPELQCNGTCQLAQKLNVSKAVNKPLLPVFESLYWYVAPQVNESNTTYIAASKSGTDIWYLINFAPIYLDQPTPPPIA